MAKSVDATTRSHSPEKSPELLDLAAIGNCPAGQETDYESQTVPQSSMPADGTMFDLEPPRQVTNYRNGPCTQRFNNNRKPRRVLAYKTSKAR